jgi:pimeloyl-ACP methyl ester carboxylesterase
MGSRIKLALVKQAATGPGRRLGTLFINPGGPGGAGTVQIPGWIDFVPKPLRERFDVVSWDPRGVGQSTAVQCFPDAGAEQAFLGELADFPLGASQQRAYINRWADLGLRCARRNGDLLEHVTTAEAARDLDLLRQAVGDSKLTYIGLSYGTFLGATYANLFPDRVRALVLDGNVAPDAWTNKGRQRASQSISLRIGSDIGTGKTLDALLDLCGRTTTANCAFSAGTGAKTRAKFDALLVRLRSGPIILGTGPSAIAVTYARLLGKLSDGLDIVQPLDNKQVPDASIGGWPAIADALQRLWEARDRPVGSAPVSSVASAPSTQPATYAGPEQGLSVVCGESPSPRASRFPRLAELEPQRAGPIGQVDPSPCANNAEVAYLVRGTLPQAGTVCQQDREPFSGSP